MLMMQEFFETLETHEWHVGSITQQLGIDVARLDGRTKHLDLGCGANANLVGFLRDRRINSSGVDFHLDRRDHYLVEADARMFLAEQQRGSFNLATAHMSVFRFGCKFFVDNLREKIKLPLPMLLFGLEREFAAMRLSLHYLANILGSQGKLLIYPYPDLLLDNPVENLLPVNLKAIRIPVYSEAEKAPLAEIFDARYYSEQLDRAEITFS